MLCCVCVVLSCTSTNPFNPLCCLLSLHCHQTKLEKKKKRRKKGGHISTPSSTTMQFRLFLTALCCPNLIIPADRCSSGLPKDEERVSTFKNRSPHVQLTEEATLTPHPVLGSRHRIFVIPQHFQRRKHLKALLGLPTDSCPQSLCTAAMSVVSSSTPTKYCSSSP